MKNPTEGINLLPKLTKKELVQTRKRTNLVLGTAAITLIVSLISGGMLLFNLYQKYSIEGLDFAFIHIDGLQGKVEDLESEIQDYRSVLAAHTELATKVNFVNEIVYYRPDYQRTLDRIQALLPDNMDIKGYEIAETNELTISGETDDYYSLALFISRAQKQDLTEGYLSDFYLESASFKDDKLNFSISAIAVFPDETGGE